MKISCDTTVAATPDQTWRVLTSFDVIERLPGATLTRDGDTATGSVKARLGSTQITYRISAGVGNRDADRRRLALTVTGMEARGDGTLVATLTVTAAAGPAGTTITVDGDITATGRGAAADDEAWKRALGRYLNAVVPAEEPAAPAAAPSSQGAIDTPVTPLRAPEPSPRPANQFAPAAAAMAGFLVLLWWLTRRRR